MKPLWWNRFIIGEKIKPQETIWDEVKDDMGILPISMLEERFSKNAIVPKEKPKKEDEETEEKKDEGPKVIRVVKDPNVVVGKEASLKQLPPAQEIARALEELDDHTMTIDFLRIVKDNGCPKPAEMKELVEERQKHPDAPLALPEQYMWVIGNLPAYQQRIDCWSFIRTYGVEQERYQRALDDFLDVVESFQQSSELPKLLGLILAVGNYLNGGTNRGQADGFDIETLGKLEGVKDAAGKDIRQFIFEIYFKEQEESECSSRGAQAYLLECQPASQQGCGRHGEVRQAGTCCLRGLRYARGGVDGQLHQQ